MPGLRVSVSGYINIPRVYLQNGPCVCEWVLMSGRMCHPSPTACKDASSSVR